jgi:hypothetical protein
MLDSQGNTQSGHVLIIFALQQWLCETASVLRHTYLASLVQHSLNLTSGFQALISVGDIYDRRYMKSEVQK